MFHVEHPPDRPTFSTFLSFARCVRPPHPNPRNPFTLCNFTPTHHLHTQQQGEIRVMSDLRRQLGPDVGRIHDVERRKIFFFRPRSEE